MEDKSAPTVFQKDGTWYLIAGEYEGVFNGWNKTLTTVQYDIDWCAYSYDGNVNDTSIFNFTNNETINVTLTSLSDGNHNVTIYCNDSAGNIGQSSLISFSIDTTLDSDNDGILDENDLCPNTELPETFELLPNHFGDIDGDGIFEKLIVKKKNEREIVDSKFTLEDTFGCSCNQILEIKHGKNIGENVRGCTKGTIIAFVKHNFSGGILTGFSFAVTGFFGDIKDSIGGMVVSKLFRQ